MRKCPHFRDGRAWYRLSKVGSAYYFSYMCTKLPLKYGHLSNEDSAYYPSYIEMCIKLPLKYGHLSNVGSAYCPSYCTYRCVQSTSEIWTPL